MCNLWCITGQIDIPGGMITVHDPYNTEVWLPPDPREVFTPEQEKERIGSNYEMITNSGMVQCQADSMIDQLVTGRPYKIRGQRGSSRPTRSPAVHRTPSPASRRVLGTASSSSASTAS